MTRRTLPDGRFIKVAGIKVEVEGSLASRFAVACRYLGVTQAFVVRQIVADIVNETEAEMEAGDAGKIG